MKSVFFDDLRGERRRNWLLVSSLMLVYKTEAKMDGPLSASEAVRGRLRPFEASFQPDRSKWNVYVFRPQKWKIAGAEERTFSFPSQAERGALWRTGKVQKFLAL